MKKCLFILKLLVCVISMSLIVNSTIYSTALDASSTPSKIDGKLIRYKKLKTSARFFRPATYTYEYAVNTKVSKRYPLDSRYVLNYKTVCVPANLGKMVSLTEVIVGQTDSIPPSNIYQKSIQLTNNPIPLTTIQGEIKELFYSPNYNSSLAMGDALFRTIYIETVNKEIYEVYYDKSSESIYNDKYQELYNSHGKMGTFTGTVVNSPNSQFPLSIKISNYTLQDTNNPTYTD